ncbi:MAG TPA: protein kinase, partial [Acidobacteriota bacterium]
MFDLYSFAPGTVLQKKYQIEEEIGRGGFSVVYKALDLRNQNAVAIKLLVPPPSVAHIAKERMKREVIAVKSLKHPAVVQIKELVEEGPLTFIVMEQILGADLQKKIDVGGPLPWEAVLEIGKEISEALNEAHRSGILHRDLKPQNILIDQNGNARLTDFGSARIQGESTVTYSGAFVGTLDYIAPEVLSGSRNDPRSDIYSLGLTLYVALTGSLPSRTSRHSPLPPAIGGYRPSNPAITIPEWICSIVARTTSADPSARFPTALNFRQALESEPKAESNFTEPTQNRTHFCILCNEFSLLTEGVCVKCKSKNSKEPQVFIFVRHEKTLNSSSQVLRQLSDSPLDSSQINDCLKGVRPIIKIPASEANAIINRLNDKNVTTEISYRLNTAQRIPKTFYALILMVVAAGIAAGLYASPIFFLTTALVAILLALGGYRLSNRPLISEKSLSQWPETTHSKIVSLWRSLSTVTAKNLAGDLIVLCRHLIVNPKSSEEILKYLSELLETSA